MIEEWMEFESPREVKAEEIYRQLFRKRPTAKCVIFSNPQGPDWVKESWYRSSVGTLESRGEEW